MSRERPEPADDADSASAPTDVEAGMPANEAAARVSAVSTKSRREIGTEAASWNGMGRGWEGDGNGLDKQMKATAAARPASGRVYPSAIPSQLSKAAIQRKIQRHASQQASVQPTRGRVALAQDRSRRLAAALFAFRGGVATELGREVTRGVACRGPPVSGVSYDTLSTLAVPRPAGARTWGMAA